MSKTHECNAITSQLRLDVVDERKRDKGGNCVIKKVMPVNSFRVSQSRFSSTSLNLGQILKGKCLLSSSGNHTHVESQVGTVEKNSSNIGPPVVF